MKKILSIMLAVMMAVGALTLASCGSNSSDKDASKADSNAADTTAQSDYEYVKNKGSLTIGYTLVQPMNYNDENNNFVGFDTEYAEAVCEKLGVKPNFVEINWDTKEVDLASKKIDCIWNGFTITPDREKSLDFSTPYLKNKQVVVIRSADKDKYTDTASLAKAKLTAETESAGEEAIQADANLKNAVYAESDKQASALLAVKAMSYDACVVDYTLAAAVVGRGDYSNLAILDVLDVDFENYGIGFRSGSDLVAKVNDITVQLSEDGTLGKITEKYGLTDLLLIK